MGPDRTRGVVEHSELQSKKSNPNARRRLGVRKEAAPSPPNHGGDEFLTCPRQVTSSGQDWGLVFRVVPEGPQCPTRKDSTDGLTPSSLYAKRCFPNGAFVREGVPNVCLALVSCSTVAVSDSTSRMTAVASASCANAGPSDPTAPTRAQHVARCEAEIPLALTVQPHSVWPAIGPAPRLVWLSQRAQAFAVCVE